MNLENLTTLTKGELMALQNALPHMSLQEKMALLDDLEKREERARLQAAKTNLLGFAQAVYPGFKIGPHHRKLAKIFEAVIAGEKLRVIINIAPRMGKLLADDTPVLTQNRGWTTHGELCVGDFVFHPSGKAVKVTGVSEKAPANVRVEFFDGSVFYCHENHEWALWSMSAKKYETVETRAFLEPRRGRWGQTSGSTKQVLTKARALHFLPPVAPLQYPPAMQTVHPYVLGAWLGDGSAGKACVTHALEDMPYVDKIVQCGYSVSAVCTHKTTGVLTTYFSGPRPNVAGRLTKELQALGVYTDKRIPEEYLRASVEQRLELLAGLVDTDGTVDKNSRCTFSSCNKLLVDGVVELVRSFGWRASVVAQAPRLSSSGIQGKKTYWMVGFQPTVPLPTALPRKQILRFPGERKIGLRDVRIEDVGKVGHCITVASEDGLYLVGDTLLPTHNSEFSSYLFPAYFLGKFPEKKIIMATHTAGLSEDFGRRVRNLIHDLAYDEIFPKTTVSDDQKAAGKWSTGAGGQYYAAGVGGALAGRGADLFVVDDPHSEQDVKTNSRLAFDTAWSWFQTGPLQRLMPGGAIIVIMTRWSRLDLTGRLLDYQTKNPESLPWEVVELPAILHEGTEQEKSLWPEQWPLKTLQTTKASIEPRYWNAQYMQQPTAEGSAIVQRAMWQIWDKEDPPDCEIILQTWDTAFEASETADYSACTTWGVWENEELGTNCLILLDAFKARMQFPELKETANKHFQKWKPEMLMVEKKASGAPLIYELRAMGIPVDEFTPSRGNDKIVRLNAVADLFASGRVWAPETRWAREVIEEVAAFPAGENDDFVDCVSMALLRFRRGGLVSTNNDEDDDDSRFRARKAAYY